MENLPANTRTNNQLANFSTCEKEVLKELVNVNCLVNYAIPDAMLLIWTKKIVELRPNLKPERLRKLINDMMEGRAKWDSRKGIQNIFLADKLPEFRASVPEPFDHK